MPRISCLVFLAEAATGAALRAEIRVFRQDPYFSNGLAPTQPTGSSSCDNHRTDIKEVAIRANSDDMFPTEMHAVGYTPCLRQ